MATTIGRPHVGRVADGAGEHDRMIREEYEALRAGGDIPGGWPYNGTSTGYEAARLVKAGAGRMFGMTGYNSKGSQQFVLIFDANTIPADGVTCVVPFTVPATSNFSLYFGKMGRWFYRGIVVCNSSTSPVKTLGSADCFFDVQFE